MYRKKNSYDTNTKNGKYKPTYYPESKHLKMLEQRQNTDDKGLLAISERLTDNADSIRRILGVNPDIEIDDYTDEYCGPRKPRPCDDIKTGRLIGLSADLKQQVLDDDYPKQIVSNPSKDTWADQFELQTFDSQGLPSATNDIYNSSDKARLANLERSFSYKEGWSQFNSGASMAYGVIPEKDLTHINMVPDYSIRALYGYNNPDGDEVVQDRKREIFTGDLKSTWRKKEETKPFFMPVNNAGYVYGQPVYDDRELDRYTPSRYRQNERLFDPVKVTPGLNLGYNEIGTQGNFDLYRPMPKTVDELRTKNNPKISYQGRMLSGMHGRELPVQAPTQTYKPETFKVNTEEDLLPSSAVNTGPRTIDNIILRRTVRPETSTEYTGIAFASDQDAGRNIPEHLREKHRESTRQNFTMPEPMQKYARDEIKFDTNTDSYQLLPGMRAQTGSTNYIGPTGGVSEAVYTNRMDSARPTLRQNSGNPHYMYAPIKSNTLRGTVPLMDSAKSTLREQSSMLNPNAPSLNTMPRVYTNDLAKPTQRESLPSLDPSNLQSSEKQYANWTDMAKATQKEINVALERPMMFNLTSGGLNTVSVQDVMKQTIKETTTGIQRPMQVNAPYEANKTPIQDSMRQTIKETTTGIQRPMQINSPYQAITSSNQDTMRQTIKETTIGIQRPMQVNSPYEARTTSLQDTMKPTIKETTVSIPYHTMLGPSYERSTVPLQDTLRPTTKETTVTIPYHTMLGSSGKTVTTPLQDSARTTTRESTVIIPHQTYMSSSQQAVNAPYQDTAKTTTKEGTVVIPYHTFIGSDGQAVKTPYQDTARATLKETTVTQPHNTHLLAVGQSQGQVPLQDTMRTTTKESTVVIPYQTYLSATSEGQGQAATFNRTPLKTTNKEMSLHSYVGQASNDAQGKGLGYLTEPKYARPTMKETTVENKYIPSAFASAEQKPVSYENAYNADLNEKKTSVYRKPMGANVTLAPDIDQIGVISINKTTNKPMMPQMGYRESVVNRPISTLTVFKNDQIPDTHFVDPLILKQLETNPFTIPSYYYAQVAKN